jgi:transposase-like protein
MEEQKPEQCPYCKSDRVVKIGFRRTVKNGKRQRYQCQECAKSFYAGDESTKSD